MKTKSIHFPNLDRITLFVFAVGFVILSSLIFVRYVHADTLPSVSISSPSDGTSYYKSANVSIIASASTSNGTSTISKVEFYDGDALKCTKTASTASAIVSCSWAVTSAINGNHVWTAKVYDTLGGIAVSNPKNLNVMIENTPPIISNWDIQPRTTVPGAVTASFSLVDSGGSHLQRVDLLRAVYNSTTCNEIDDHNCSWTKVGTLTAPNGLDNWTGTLTNTVSSTGSFIYGITVYDNSGNSVYETNGIKVTIVVPESTLLPANGTLFSSPGTTEVTATTPDTSVTKIEFYDNDILKCTDLAAPYICPWSFSNVDSGTHVWIAKSYNNAGTNISNPMTYGVDYFNQAKFVQSNSASLKRGVYDAAFINKLSKLSNAEMINEATAVGLVVNHYEIKDDSGTVETISYSIVDPNTNETVFSRDTHADYFPEAPVAQESTSSSSLLSVLWSKTKDLANYSLSAINFAEALKQKLLAFWFVPKNSVDQNVATASVILANTGDGTYSYSSCKISNTATALVYQGKLDGFKDTKNITVALHVTELYQDPDQRVRDVYSSTYKVLNDAIDTINKALDNYNKNGLSAANVPRFSVAQSENTADYGISIRNESFFGMENMNHAVAGTTYNHGLGAKEHANTYLNADQILRGNISGDKLKAVLMHEMLHTLGLGHMKGVLGVMNPGSGYKFSQSISDDEINLLIVAHDLNSTLSPTDCSTGDRNNVQISTRTSISQEFSAPNKAGNLIVAAVGFSGVIPDQSILNNYTCSDTQGNTYANYLKTNVKYPSNQVQVDPDLSHYINSTTPRVGVAICYAANIKSGLNTVKVEFPSDTGIISDLELSINEYGGIAKNDPFYHGSSGQGMAVTHNITGDVMHTASYWSGDTMPYPVFNTHLTNKIGQNGIPDGYLGFAAFSLAPNESRSTDVSEGYTARYTSTKFSTEDTVGPIQVYEIKPSPDVSSSYYQFYKGYVTPLRKIVELNSPKKSFEVADEFIVFKTKSGPDDNTAPIISIDSPENDAFVTGIILVSAQASDNEAVDHVRFQLDGTDIGSIYYSAPYWLLLDSESIGKGNHTLSAKAYDASGNVGVAPPVKIKVDTPPEVSITSPSDGTIYKEEAKLIGKIIEASASDDILVTKVEFYDNANLKCSVIIKPYKCEWKFDSSDNGAHNWVAKAYDESGNIGTSDPVIFTINIDAIPPVVSITSPVNNTSFVTGTSVTLEANASDNDEVASVRFKIDGVYVGNEDTVSPYATTWVATEGVHTLISIAKDTSGNVSVSEPVTLDVAVRSHITLTPSSFSSTAIKGSNTVYKSVNLTGNSLAPINWSATTSQSWCHVSPLTGTKPVNSVNAILDVSLDTNINPGTYNCQVKISDQNADNSPQSINVDYVLSADTVAPSVSIVTPVASSTYTTLQTITITANYSDNAGVSAMNKFERYIDGYKIGGGSGYISTSDTYNWSITAANNGAHVYSIKVYDVSGNVGTASVNINVNIPVPDTTFPTVSISSPSSNSTQSGTITVSASASDNVGVVGVQFKIDGSNLGSEDTTSPYSASLDTKTKSNGSHTLTAVARDAAGNIKTSLPITVTVSNVSTPINIAPSGTAYRWRSNSSATSNNNRFTASGLNDNNLTTDVNLNGGTGESTISYEAGGVIWSTSKSIKTVKFINGTWVTGGDGGFGANLTLQTTTDGVTWVNTSWAVFPSYSYNSGAVSGVTYTFTGSPVSVRGIRVSGQVRTKSVSSYWASMREVQAF